ncbi:angiopoietin-related protein 3-like [Drosophila bipectinata]|uniref:angiopoietin-related protein 3-like n=1 Tax=Drosophila bipectinata TaxID=42026 RepID=UPI0038B3A93F
MIFPVVLISAIFLISASLGSEETCHPLEEECETINVQRYFEKCHKKDVQLLRCKTDYSELQKQYSDLQSEDLKQSEISKCQQSYSDLVRKHWEVQSQLSDEKVKNEQLHSKHLEVENLKALIKQQSEGIDLLKDQIRELKEKSELATFRENIDKLEKIVKNGGIHENNPTKSEVGTGELPTTPFPNINIQTTPKTETIDFPDTCPRNQNETLVHREIQLPGSDPFKVVCMSDSYIGSRWLKVLKKMSDSQIFNRTYEDYERGFGDVGTDGFGEFFVGLNRLHRLTSGKPHEVILLTTAGERLCDHFVVGDRSEGYKVKNIDNCDDLMIPKQGSKFSTFDRDEDGVPDRNLAEEEGYGWWFDPAMSYKNELIYMYIRRKD